MMENYFYLNEQREQKGPCSPEELLQNDVRPTTLVWKDGMTDWMPAGEVEELKALFVNREGSVPPPVPPKSPVVPKRSKPDNWLVWAILSTILCCLPLGVVSIIYAAKVDNLWASGQYDEAERASKNARLFFFLALILGIVGSLIAFAGGIVSSLIVNSASFIDGFNVGYINV